jgi:DNA-binding PadR family transcriptional regulator
VAAVTERALLAFVVVDDAPISLTTTSYVVLGLVRRMGPVTVYAMKARIAVSIGYFWSFPHSQLYAEPARLTAAGYLDEETETGGRKRRRFAITAKGRAALEAWLAEPSTENTELRDLGLLKLHFSSASSPSSIVGLAREQEKVHAHRLAEYEALRIHVVDVATPAELATLTMGLRFEAMAVDYWHQIATDPPE